MPASKYSMQPTIDVLRSARQNRRMSQGELGQAMGLPQSHVSDIEHGKKDIRLSTLIEMARVLGLELLLVPREMVLPVETLIHASPSEDLQERPAYALDDLNRDEE